MGHKETSSHRKVSRGIHSHCPIKRDVTSLAELTLFLRAPVVGHGDLAINQKGSDNNEVRPRFSGRDNAVASSQLGRTYH